MTEFYGVKLDRDDPYLEFNLARLEKRFRNRYLGSIEKESKRQQVGKTIHKTVLKSKEANKKRMEMVVILQFLLLKHE